ncbi:hypothetical protein D9M68_607570 [compost metagenome]
MPHRHRQHLHRIVAHFPVQAERIVPRPADEKSGIAAHVADLAQHRPQAAHGLGVRVASHHHAQFGHAPARRLRLAQRISLLHQHVEIAVDGGPLHARRPRDIDDVHPRRAGLAQDAQHAQAAAQYARPRLFRFWFVQFLDTLR